MEFANRTVLITGAAGNLGRAVAHAFAARGAKLVLLDRRRDSLEQAFGADVALQMLIACDLTDAGQVKQAVAAACERFGAIDVLCNLAGAFRMGPAVHETPDEDLDWLFDLNLRSVLNAVRAVVPAMLDADGGKIVNVGARAAQQGIGQMGAYCAAKAAVIRLTESMAAELRERNINVNCVLPSIIDTAENRAAMPDADPNRWVSPAALADTIVFLASDAARAIHGAALPVMGLS